jgi:hypothetical protein
VYYIGEDGNETGCWSGIREANTIFGWMSEEIERRPNNRNGGQETNSDPTTAFPEWETNIDSRLCKAFDRHDFTFKSLSINASIMPEHIVGYGPPESTCATDNPVQGGE